MVTLADFRVTNRYCTWRGCVIGLAFITLTGCDELPETAAPPAVKSAAIRIQKSATHITAPRDDQGLIDYLKAANDRHGKGTTADDNWEVAVRLAVSSPMMDDETRATYFGLLGVPDPNGSPSAGPRFAPLVGEARRQFTQLDGSWGAEDLPELAEWLRLNNEALDSLAKCAQRTHCYLPLVATSPGYRETVESYRGRFAGASVDSRDVILRELVTGLNGNSGPLARHYPLTLRLLSDHQDVARGFFARAMLRLGTKEIAGARTDLAAVHRIAYLISRGTLTEWVVAYSLEQLAARGDVAMLQSENLSPSGEEEYLKALTTMPILVPVADIIDIDDRHVALDSMQFAAANMRESIAELEKFKDHQIDLVKAIIAKVDWDAALQELNGRYDQLVTAARETEPAKRQAALDAILATRQCFEMWAGARLLGGLENARDSEAAELAKWMAEVYFVRCSTPGVIALDIEARTRRDVIRAGFAARKYRLDNGALPETIDDLIPLLLKLPLDGFTGKPLLFHS